MFSDIIPAGGNIIYGLKPDGTLQWYRHNAFNDAASNSLTALERDENGNIRPGGITSLTPPWEGPKQVLSGLRDYDKFFSGSDGILYAIDRGGDLFWNRNDGFREGASQWAGWKKVGTGWGDFTKVFSMGEGIVYAVAADGSLMWYRHDAYKTGDFQWTGPETVGTGWNQFKDILPAGGGVILAVKPDGSIVWYKHEDYLQGRSRGPVAASAVLRPKWTGPVTIATGWANYRDILALLPQSTPQGTSVH